MSGMTVTLFLIPQPEGGFIAKCDQFAAWKYRTPENWMNLDAVRLAEESLRGHIAEHIGISRYVIPTRTASPV